MPVGGSAVVEVFFSCHGACIWTCLKASMRKHKTVLVGVCSITSGTAGGNCKEHTTQRIAMGQHKKRSCTKKNKYTRVEHVGGNPTLRAASFVSGNPTPNASFYPYQVRLFALKEILGTERLSLTWLPLAESRFAETVGTLASSGASKTNFWAMASCGRKDRHHPQNGRKHEAKGVGHPLRV